MHALLLIGYAILATVGIWKIPFLRKSGIRPGWLWVLFALHAVTGWVHNWIAYRYFPNHGDIWNYFTLSFLYRHRLLSEFNLFLSDNSTWTYITHNGIVFIQMLLDLLSGDDMNINTLLFAFPVFLGNVALFRVLRRRFQGDTPAAMSVFLIPSVLFWTACIYREGMLYLLLGFLFYHLDRLSSPPGATSNSRPSLSSTPRPNPVARRSLYYSIALFLLIAYFRLAVAIIVIPALLAWWWLEYPHSRRGRLTLATAVIILLVLTLTVPALRDPILRSVTSEQTSFQILEGRSRLPLPVLNGTLTSIWQALPAAIRNGFFEPLPGSGGATTYLAISIELIFIWLIVVLAAIHFLRRLARPAPPTLNAPVPRPAAGHTPAFSIACLLFALAGMLIIGLVVPFAGTIVRYRSIYLPFLLAPALHSLRYLPLFQSIESLLTNKLKIFI